MSAEKIHLLSSLGRKIYSLSKNNICIHWLNNCKKNRANYDIILTVNFILWIILENNGNLQKSLENFY